MMHKHAVKTTFSKQRPFALLCGLVFCLLLAGTSAWSQVPENIPDIPITPELKDKIEKAIQEKEAGEKPNEQEQPETDISTKPESKPLIAQSSRFSRIELLFKKNLELLGPKDMDLVQFGYKTFNETIKNYATAQNTAVSDLYVLNPGDEIIITFWGGTEGIYNAVIGASGTATLPKVGPIPIAGIQFGDIEEHIKSFYLKYFEKVNLKVSMGKLRTISVFVMGEVKQPGSLLLSSLPTVFSAIHLAGGPTKMGSMRRIRLMRNGNMIQEIDLYDFLLSGNDSANVQLKDGDIIFVPLIGQVAGISGEVLRPGIYEFSSNDEMHLDSVFKYAGGQMVSSDTSRVQCLTVNQKEKIVTDFDLEETMPEDIKLQDSDLVLVHRISDALTRVVYLSGHVLKPGVYELTSEMRLVDLIGGFQCLQPEPYLEYGMILRRHQPDARPERLDFHLGRLLAEGASSAENYVLKPNDRVRIFSKTAMLSQNNVEIIGAIKNPGKYLIIPGMMIKDLIHQAGLFAADTYMKTAVLSRLIQSADGFVYKDILINLNDVMADLPEANLALQQKDILRLQHLPGVNAGRSAVIPALVTIKGAVSQPETYELKSEMRIKDLILTAGNLKRDAYMGDFELSRAIKTPEGMEYERRRLNLQKVLDEDLEHNLYLAEFDIISIPRRPDWTVDHAAKLEGEILFPGEYPISADERLSSVLKRAGGFTDHAYLRGAVLIRESIRNEEEAKIDRFIEEQKAKIMAEAAAYAAGKNVTLSAESKEGSNVDAALIENQIATLELIRERMVIGRMVIRLTPLDEFTGSQDDIVLESGDILTIPPVPAHVGVIGSVWNPVSMLFEQDKDVTYYLSRAGGFLPDADVKSVYVIKSDGSASPARQVVSLFPGDVVVIPSMIKPKVHALPILRDVSTILGNFTLTAASMAALFAL